MGTEPPPDGEASPVPALDPEKMIAFAATLRSIGLRIYAGFIGVDTSDSKAIAIFDMGEDEKKTLALWAPEAAQYFGPYIGVDGPIGAWTFAGIYIAGMWGACSRLKALKPIQVEVDPTTVPIGEAPIVQYGQENGSRSTLTSPFPR